MNYVIFNKKFNKNEEYQNIFEVIEEINGIKIKDLLEQKHDVKLYEKDYYKILLRNIGDDIFFIKNEDNKIIGEVEMYFCDKELYYSERFDCDFCKSGCAVLKLIHKFWLEYYKIDNDNDTMECDNCYKGEIEYFFNNIKDYEKIIWKPLFKQTNYFEYEDYKVYLFHKNLIGE